MSTTTLKDHGRESEKHGFIPYFNWATFKLHFNENQISPDDVESWCVENCQGLYRTQTYIHKDSKRVFVDGVETKQFEEKIIYIDKVYLNDPRDVVAIKLMWDIMELTQIDEPPSRPRIKRIVKRRALSKARTV